MKKIVLSALGLFLTLYVFSLIYIGFYTTYDNARVSDTILVLGAKSEYNNMVNPCLVARVDKGVALYKKGFAKKIIMSGGDDAFEKDNQAKLMRVLATEKGVPQKNIILEKASGNTYENLLYTKRIMEKEKLSSVIIVSDPYHLARALLTAKTLHMDATVSPASESPCWSKYTFVSFDYFRDGFALLAYIGEGKIQLFPRATTCFFCYFP